MKSDEEFQGGIIVNLTLLWLIWGIWTVLTAFLALFGILLIFALFMRIIMNQCDNQCVFMGLMGIGTWVLFLSNIYITSGISKLDYFRWKLLVIESGLIGIVLGFVSLYQILDIGSEIKLFGITIIHSLNDQFSILVTLIGTGFCLVSLYLAFNVRDIFRKA